MLLYLNQICFKNDNMNIYHLAFGVNQKFCHIFSTIQIAQHIFFRTNPYFQGIQKAGAENPRIFHSCFLLIFVSDVQSTSDIASGRIAEMCKRNISRFA